MTGMTGGDSTGLKPLPNEQQFLARRNISSGKYVGWYLKA
jgi:hypothetical protein